MLLLCYIIQMITYIILNDVYLERKSSTVFLTHKLVQVDVCRLLVSIMSGSVVGVAKSHLLLASQGNTSVCRSYQFTTTAYWAVDLRKAVTIYIYI